MNPKTTNIITFGSIALIVFYVVLVGPDGSSAWYSERAIGVGLGLGVLITITLLIYRKMLRKRCTQPTAATITKLVARIGVPQNKIITFTYADATGVTYTSQLEYTEQQLGNLVPGDRIMIMVNPLKPKEHVSFDYPVREGSELPR
jgi:hypothetical protein